MEFERADPSVVRSIKQRDLLNEWLRAVGKLRSLPALADYQPDRLADEQPDLMSFDVAGEADNARFLITHEGTRLTATYGNDHVDPDKRTNRYLDDAIGPGTICPRRRPVSDLRNAKAADLFGVEGAGSGRQGCVL